MGVDFSTTLGYGMAGGTEEWPAVIKELGDDQYGPEDYEVIDWLDERYPSFGFDISGNHMDGKTFWLFYLKGTEIVDFNYENMNGLYEFNDIDLSPDQVRDLIGLRDELGLTLDSIGWKLIFNVN
jgi:hypothetical protein